MMKENFATMKTLAEYTTLLVWSALILGYLHNPWLQHNHLSLREYSHHQIGGQAFALNCAIKQRFLLIHLGILFSNTVWRIW